jgi:hypothetical protein
LRNGHLLFQKKENRDRRAKELKSQGYTVFRSSIRNQLLHPQYIEDWGEEISEADRGIGNTIYKTHFAALYHLDWE